jgi:hypothetical protein
VTTGDVLAAELRHLPRRMGSTAGFLLYLMVLAAFGVLVPMRWGFEFLNPMVLAAYASMSALFVAPVAADSFFSIRELRGQPSHNYRALVLGRAIFIAAWGWLSAALVLATGLATLNIANRRGGVLLPPALFLASLALFSASASAFVTSLGAAVATGAKSAARAKRGLRTGFLLLLLLFLLTLRQAPEEWRYRLIQQLSAERFPWFALIASLHMWFFAALMLRIAHGKVVETLRDRAHPLGLAEP